MALTNETSRVQFDGPDGSTVFAIPFPFLENSHIKVVLTDADGADTMLAEVTDYDLLNNVTGGTLTLVVALAAGELLTVYRELPLTQPADYANQDAFPAESHETALDRLTMLVQQISRTLARSVRFTESSPDQDPINVNVAPTTVWGYDGDGQFVLRDPAALQEFLDLTAGTSGTNPVATWAVAGDRPSKVPDYLGQVGVQRDDSSIWIAHGLSAGNWTLFAIHDGTMAADSQTRPPTQKSVKDYVASVTETLQNQIDSLNTLIGDNGLVEVPVGTVLPWFSADLPGDDTWIFCKGQTLSRAEYPELFLHWGTKFGAGDGSTTFLAADLRSMFLRGFDDSRGIDPGRTLGDYQADKVAAHVHASHPLLDPSLAVRVGAFGTGYSPTYGTYGFSGYNQAYGTETVPKNICCNYIVKAVSRGSGDGNGIWYQDWMFAQDEPMDNVTRFVGYVPLSLVCSQVFICHNTTGSGTPTLQVSVGGTNLFPSAVSLTALTKTVLKAAFASAFSSGAISGGARIEATVAALPGCAVLSGWKGLRLAFIGRRAVS